MKGVYMERSLYEAVELCIRQYDGDTPSMLGNVLWTCGQYEKGIVTVPPLRQGIRDKTT